MKRLGLILFLLVGVSLAARAGIIYSATSGAIPDGSAAGWSATAAASGYLPSILDVTVNLNLSGGYNGDLYAYLSYGGVLVPLLNRVGVTGQAAEFVWVCGHRFQHYPEFVGCARRAFLWELQPEPERERTVDGDVAAGRADH